MVTPTGLETRVTAVKGRCLNPLDQGAVLKHKIDYSTAKLTMTRYFLHNFAIIFELCYK